MKSVIGTFFKTIDKAQEHAEHKKKMWKGKIDFVVVGGNNGYIVISETAARACGIREYQENTLPL